MPGQEREDIDKPSSIPHPIIEDVPILTAGRKALRRLPIELLRKCTDKFDPTSFLVL
jgi:hypothetical protein